MDKRTDVRAGGIVVFRDRGDRRQVLIVHRPRYDDWSLPKGKAKADEYIQAAAVRETQEETGVETVINGLVGTTRYRVGRKNKSVTWWFGQEIGSGTWVPDAEIDRRIWIDCRTAVKTLSYPDECAVLESAMKMPAQKPLLILRHAKAMDRKNWRPERDADRRLTERGRRQAKALIDLLKAYGVTRLISSSSTRCMDTLRPMGKALHSELQPHTQLSEECAAADPGAVATLMAELVKDNLESAGVSVICGHRPVFPLMLAAAHAPAVTLKPAELLVLYCNPDGTPRDLEKTQSRL